MSYVHCLSNIFDPLSIFQNEEPKKDLRKTRKIGKKGKKKLLRNVTTDVRDYGSPEPVRKVYSRHGGRGRVKFGTRVQPKTVYNPLTV